MGLIAVAAKGREAVRPAGACLARLFLILSISAPSAALSVELSGEQVAAGNGYSCAVGTDATLLCWGLQPFLKFGSMPNLPQPVPLLINGGQAEARQVSLGVHHACALTSVGDVLCWGSNQTRQLGKAVHAVSETRLQRPTSAVPLAVPGISNIRSIAAGGFHTCAVTEKGGAVCWGADRQSQLGTTEDAVGPVSVTGLETGVETISAGLLHTCALLMDGTVKCWGDGSSGQLGIGSTPDEPQVTPQVVTGLGGKVTSLAAGRDHTCAVLESGEVRCWGSNRFGQIGDSTQTNRPSPVRVVGLPEKAVAVSAGAGFTCARLASGPPACWGWDDYGQLASGAAPGKADENGFTVQTSPVLVASLEGDLKDLDGGQGHTCVVTKASEVKCWGMNDDGQLGDGTLWDRGQPVAPVLTSNAASEASAGTTQSTTNAAGSDTTADIELQGIDVSYYSGRIDWSKFQAADYDFAFVRATVGVDYKDPLFEYHWDRMKQLGLRPGAYHYFVAKDDPIAQARWFIDNVGLSPGDLIPAVDVESLGTDPPADLSARLKKFVELIESYYGVAPIIYTAPTFWDRNMSDQFGAYPLWIADYETDEPRLPKGWDRWSLWQWKGDAALSGISRIVDLNRFRGSQAEWLGLVIDGTKSSTSAD